MEFLVGLGRVLGMVVANKVALGKAKHSLGKGVLRCSSRSEGISVAV